MAQIVGFEFGPFEELSELEWTFFLSSASTWNLVHDVGYVSVRCANTDHMQEFALTGRGGFVCTASASGGSANKTVLGCQCHIRSVAVIWPIFGHPVFEYETHVYWRGAVPTRTFGICIDDWSLSSLRVLKLIEFLIANTTIAVCIVTFPHNVNPVLSTRNTCVTHVLVGNPRVVAESVDAELVNSEMRRLLQEQHAFIGRCR